MRIPINECNVSVRRIDTGLAGFRQIFLKHAKAWFYVKDNTSYGFVEGYLDNQMSTHQKLLIWAS